VRWSSSRLHFCVVDPWRDGQLRERRLTRTGQGEYGDQQSGYSHNCSCCFIFLSSPPLCTAASALASPLTLSLSPFGRERPPTSSCVHTLTHPRISTSPVVSLLPARSPCYITNHPRRCPRRTALSPPAARVDERHPRQLGLIGSFSGAAIADWSTKALGRCTLQTNAARGPHSSHDTDSRLNVVKPVLGCGQQPALTRASPQLSSTPRRGPCAGSRRLNLHPHPPLHQTEPLILRTPSLT